MCLFVKKEKQNKTKNETIARKDSTNKNCNVSSIIIKCTLVLSLVARLVICQCSFFLFLFLSFLLLLIIKEHEQDTRIMNDDDLEPRNQMSVVCIHFEIMSAQKKEKEKVKERKILNKIFSLSLKIKLR